MIEIINLSKDFRQGVIFSKPKFIHAIKEINLHIKEGESFGLLGVNGAGKTTLIKILCGLILPTSGTARISGLNILKDKVKGIIGFANSEERSFYWRLTGKQNLDFFARLYGLYGARVKRRIDYLFDLLQIETPDRRIQEYSVGMRQRLLIAKSLIHDPKVIFMDEPTKSLDYFSASRLRKFIKEELILRQKKTIFLTTHNLEEAQEMAGRIAIIHKGEIKSAGTIEELRRTIGIPTARLADIFEAYIK